jgi:N-acetylglucosaminyl-diphospho-decaprenol L-rhamnosyltransferase
MHRRRQSRFNHTLRQMLPHGFMNLCLFSPWCFRTGPLSSRSKSQISPLGATKRDSIREVDIVSGCFLLIRKRLWDELEGFDPLFFMYGEDVGLCSRAGALGYAPLITPDAAIIHYIRASEWPLARKMAQLLAAKITLAGRHWGWPKRPFGRLLFRLYPYTCIASP